MKAFRFRIGFTVDVPLDRLPELREMRIRLRRAARVLTDVDCDADISNLADVVNAVEQLASIVRRCHASAHNRPDADQQEGDAHV
jgi:hypothetical protein